MRAITYLITSFTLLVGAAMYSTPLVDFESRTGSGERDTTTVPGERPMKEWAITDVTWDDIPAPEGNPITESKVELGRKLYFDPRLSKTNTTSCATCHDPSKGYSDGRRFLKGDDGVVGPRTTPTVINLAWSELFFWDGRGSSLEEQAKGPITAEHEMGEELETLPKELEEAGYLPAFKKAYGPDASITPDNILKAIGTFERTLVSHNAPFDQYMRGKKDAMSRSQVRGMKLFQDKANCAECHSGPHFTDFGFHNIGVDTTDLGRYEHLPIPAMKYAFKTPSLRDVEYRAPYLHNGSEETLRGVVEFYNRGGNPEAQETSNLDNEPLQLTEREISDLVAFMKALSGEGAHAISPPDLPNEEELPEDADISGR